MNKITGFIKKHKKLSIGLSIFIILLLIVILIKVILFPSADGDVYGDRLKDIDKYEISKKTSKKIIKELESQTSVKSVEYNNEGRILSFVIVLDTEIKNSDAKKYANIIADGLKDKYKEYYDIQVMFDTEKETDTYPISGYKNKTSNSFVWSGNNE